MQAATEKIRDVPAGAECHVAQFGYDEAQTQTRSTGRVRGEALRYMRHRKPRLQRGYEREQETGKQCKAVPTLRKQADSVYTEPACFMLVGALPSTSKRRGKSQRDFLLCGPVCINTGIACLFSPKMKRTSERIVKFHSLAQFISNFSDNSVSSFTVSCV